MVVHLELVVLLELGSSVAPKQALTSNEIHCWEMFVEEGSLTKAPLFFLNKKLANVCHDNSLITIFECYNRKGNT